MGFSYRVVYNSLFEFILMVVSRKLIEEVLTS